MAWVVAHIGLKRYLKLVTPLDPRLRRVPEDSGPPRPKHAYLKIVYHRGPKVYLRIVAHLGQKACLRKGADVGPTRYT